MLSIILSYWLLQRKTHLLYQVFKLIFIVVRILDYLYFIMYNHSINHYKYSPEVIIFGINLACFSNIVEKINSSPIYDLVR